MPFFRITHPDTGAESYLAGTYHIGDKQVATLPIEVLTAFLNAVTFITESDWFDKNREELEEQLNTMEANWFAQHRNMNIDDKLRLELNAHILKVIRPLIQAGWLPSSWEPKQDQSPAELLAFSRKLIRGMPIRHVMPHLLPPMTDIEPLDELLVRQAALMGKRLVYLETPIEGLQALYGKTLNLKEQLEFCHTMANSKKEEQAHELRRLLKLYLTGDLEAMLEIAQYASIGSIAVKKYYEQFLGFRDKQFSDNMIPYLKEGGAFVAVGALHLKGIAETLRKQGFILERIELSERKYPISSEHFLAEIGKHDVQTLSVYIQDVLKHHPPTFLCSLSDLKDLFKASPKRFALLCQAWKTTHPTSLFNFLLNNPSLLPQWRTYIGEVENLLSFVNMPTRNKPMLIKLAEALLRKDKVTIKEQVDKLIGAAKENSPVALWSPISLLLSPITIGGLKRRLSGLNPCFIKSINASLGVNWEAYISGILEPGNRLGY